MRHWFETWLIWWLVLALPGQGFAAANLMPCGPSHHAATLQATLPGTAPVPASSGQWHATGHDRLGNAESGAPDPAWVRAPVQAPAQAPSPALAHAPSHALAHAHPESPAEPRHGADAASIAEATESADPTEPAVIPAKSKCSACASCCSSVALLASSAALPGREPALQAPATPVADVAVFVTGGPDRPPRHTAA